MKKLGIVICVIMIISLVGCNTKPSTTTKPKPGQGTAQTSKKTTSSAVSVHYKNGVYTALDDKWAYGQESATVTIKGGKITYITLKRLDTKGKEVNYKDWVGKKQANGEIKPNLKKFRVEMATRMLAKQTYKVDTIASATKSTSGWKVAVQRALDKAK
jgi:uncharacterized protein with FMN-binding domain